MSVMNQIKLSPNKNSDQMRDEISHLNETRNNWFVILDDDPTGSQCVHDIPVITNWDTKNIEWAFKQPEKAFFLLTNSRSLTEDEAYVILNQVMANLEEVALKLNVSYSVMSRGDSTLRGHFPLETELIKSRKSSYKKSKVITLFVPAYIEAGRITKGDTHWVKEEESFIPVGESDYANDSTFGFNNSNLHKFIDEKYKGKNTPVTIGVSLEVIRELGSAAIAEMFVNTENDSLFVINAENNSDLDVVSLAAISAENDGVEIVYRVGPSFVASRLGIKQFEQSKSRTLIHNKVKKGNGLIVVGSHVPNTTAQLEYLKNSDTPVGFVEVDVKKIINPITRQEEVDRAISALEVSLSNRDSVLVTSRNVEKSENPTDSLAIAVNVAAALVEITSYILSNHEIAWVVAKGGITSNDLLTKTLKMDRARIVGQIFPGFVSVWIPCSDDQILGKEIPIVIFAGNVGNQTSLLETIAILKNTEDFQIDRKLDAS